MATDEQRARRRAQRELAKAVHEKRRHILPSQLKGTGGKARLDYADAIIAGTEKRPRNGSREARGLARIAALSDQGKLDPKYAAAFKDYWYHKKDEAREADNEADADRESDADSEDSDEE